jgi:hypothetical protein
MSTSQHSLLLLLLLAPVNAVALQDCMCDVLEHGSGRCYCGVLLWQQHCRLCLPSGILALLFSCCQSHCDKCMQLLLHVKQQSLSKTKHGHKARQASGRSPTIWTQSYLTQGSNHASHRLALPSVITQTIYVSERVQQAALAAFSAHVCFAGGSVQCLFVDNANSMVLAAMLDKVTRAYDLESKHPAIKYVGHEEVVRGIDYLPEKGLYITGERLFHQLATYL